MKLICSVSLGDRTLHAGNSKKRHVNSTLALCHNAKLKNFCIIWFTEQNKNGTKYEVKNISKVLTRFEHEGKATIQFQAPQHDLYIQADPILLKGFLHLLKEAVENKTPKNDLMFYSMDVTDSKPVDIRLNLETLFDYPTKGFSPSLEIMSINNISLTTINKGIFQLTKLRVLDLSHNSLESFPIELSRLPCLTELYMSHNQLGKATPKMWSWLGSNYSKNWKVLNLQNNFLTYLPNSLVKLQDLATLHVDCNQLKWLPKRIGVLKNLRVLSVSNNLITFLPASARKLCLQTFYLSYNNWDATHPQKITPVVTKLSTLSLKEIALHRVLHLQLSFTPEDLPLTLIEELQNAEYCVCGTACLSNHIHQLELLSLTTIAQNISVSPTSLLFIPIERYFCSSKCFNSALANRRKRIER